jgi:hypothetical protein
MPQPVSNTTTVVSGSLLANKISYVVDGQSRNYRGGFGGLSWMSEAPAANNVIFIGNTSTIGRGPADKPLFYPSFNNTQANIVYAVNTLPGSPRNFTTSASAYNWAVTNNFFINNSDNPIPRIDADSMFLCLDAEQATSFPQTGTSWYDMSGANYTVTGTNNPTWNYGNGRSYWRFDGVDDYFAFSSTPPIAQSTYTSTIEVWAKSINNVPTFQVMFGGGVQNTNQGYYYGFRQDNANFMYAFYANDQDGPTPRDNRVWNHYVGVYNQATGARYRYFNGELLSPSQASGVTPTSAQKFTIGAFDDTSTGPQYFYNGYISKVRGYSKELTQSEIKQNYFQSNIVQDGLVFMVDANNIVSYEGSGTTWYNLTGSSGNALLYNGPTYVPQYGGGISRDNTDDFISASISVSTTTNYSVETWFKANPQTGANYNALISAWNAPGGGAGSWELQFLNGTLGVHPTYTVAYTPNTVAHAVYTQNGTETKIYLNGVLQQTSTTSGVDLRNGSVGIGNLSAPGYGGYNLESTFYNVRLYNKTLSASEVQQNYQATKDKFQGQQIVTNGLIFNLDAANKDSYPGTGTTWYDLSGNNYNGTLVNGPTFLPNQNGGIFNFDYVDDYVSIGNNLGSPSTFTLNAWVRSSNISQPQNIFNGNPPFFLRITSSTIRCAVYTGTWIFVNGSITLSSNTWYNLVLTYDQSTVKGYVNGVLDVNSVKTGTPIYGALNTLGFTTGGEDAPSVTNIAVAQVYNRALSATEIAQNYNATKGRFGL